MLTLAGDQLGTPSYMAPEQVEDSTQVGPATDVYGLGATLYYAVTGKVPFEGKGAIAVMEKVLKEEAPRASSKGDGVPAALDELLDWCLAKDYDARPADCHELAALLKLVQQDPDDVTAITARRHRAVQKSGGGSPLLIIVMVVLLALAAGAAWFFLK